MKTLPEHIEQVDSFYKAKSEATFNVDLPEGLWDGLVNQLPSSPLVPTHTVASHKMWWKSINYFHGAGFFIAGLVFSYACYHFLSPSSGTSSKQENTISTPPPLAKETYPSSPALPQKERETSVQATSPSSEKLPRKQTITEPIMDDNQRVVEQTEENQPSEQTETNGLHLEKHQQEEIKTTELPVSTEKSQEPVYEDFYQKHSKKTQDSMSKKLFIPKK